MSLARQGKRAHRVVAEELGFSKKRHKRFKKTKDHDEQHMFGGSMSHQLSWLIRIIKATQAATKSPTRRGQQMQQSLEQPAPTKEEATVECQRLIELCSPCKQTTKLRESRRKQRQTPRSAKKALERWSSAKQWASTQRRGACGVMIGAACRKLSATILVRELKEDSTRQCNHVERPQPGEQRERAAERRRALLALVGASSKGSKNSCTQALGAHD